MNSDKRPKLMAPNELMAPIVLMASLACWLLTLSPAAAGPALVYDATTRQVLYAEHADHPWYPASLAKLMTAYIVFQSWKTGKAEPTTKLTISAKANSRPKMRLGLGPGKVLTYEEAMSALILYSANDIAVALAEAVAGSEAAFVEEMNAATTRLGMTSTHFVNANGLPGEGQYTTARDLAILTNVILEQFPERAGLFSLKMAPVGGRTVSTHNPVLLRLPGGDGMKTGFTCSAGYNIIASATRDGHRLVAVVLGEQTSAKREARTNALLESGFRTLEPSPESTPQLLDTLPVEAFDAEQIRALNLTKRFKDCLPPPPELDADGNPVCQQVRVPRSAKARVAAQRSKSKAAPCTPPAMAKIAPKNAPKQAAKIKPATKQTAKLVARRVRPTSSQSPEEAE